MKRFGQWLTESVQTLGPWGLFLVAFADSAFVPLPQGVDALLIAQAIAAPSTAWLAAGLAVIGSVLGSLVLYGLARRGGRLMLEGHVSPRGVEKLERRTRRYGAFLLLPPMAIPVPLPTKIFVIAAGVFQMRVSHFVAAAACGRSIRYFGEAALAVRYGEDTMDLVRSNLPAALAVILLLTVLFFAIHRYSTARVRH
jgi:membrane protein YqaA with SNARE-associated domain